MAINFPTSPGIDDTHSASGKTWKYDGTSWNLVIASTSVGSAGAKGDKGARADDSPQEFDMFWLAVVSSCLLYTSPSPRDATLSRMPSSA